MNDYLIFLVTVPNLNEAKKIAHHLVEQKLAPCVNIVPGIISIYEWKKNIEEEEELLLLIKTNEDNSENLINSIKKLHSYEVPECIGFKIEKGSKTYLEWIDEVLGSSVD